MATIKLNNLTRFLRNLKHTFIPKDVSENYVEGIQTTETNEWIGECKADAEIYKEKKIILYRLNKANPAGTAVTLKIQDENGLEYFYGWDATRDDVSVIQPKETQKIGVYNGSTAFAEACPAGTVLRLVFRMKYIDHWSTPVWSIEDKYLSPDNNGNVVITGDVSATSLSCGRTGNTGTKSIAFGSNVVASGTCSHAEGSGTQASGAHSYAGGYYTEACGANEYVLGAYNTERNIYPDWTADTSYAVGDKVSYYSEAMSVGVLGYKCIEANNDSTFDESKWEKLPSNCDALFVIGNGTSINDKSDAMVVTQDGNAEFAGDVIAGGCGGSNPISLANHTHAISELSGVLPTEKGGTGLSASPSILTDLGSTSADNVLKASPRPGVTGILSTTNGGTGNSTGNAPTATKLATSRTVQTNLASTSTASFDGSANIAPGVTGTLPPANGGTGQTTLQATRNAMGLGNTTGALPLANGGTGVSVSSYSELGAAIGIPIIERETYQTSSAVPGNTYTCTKTKTGYTCYPISVAIGNAKWSAHFYSLNSGTCKVRISQVEESSSSIDVGETIVVYWLCVPS